MPIQPKPYLYEYKRETAWFLSRSQYGTTPQLYMGVVDDDKHFVMFDKPELFMKLINDFISK